MFTVVTKIHNDLPKEAIIYTSSTILDKWCFYFIPSTNEIIWRKGINKIEELSKEQKDEMEHNFLVSWHSKQNLNKDK